MILSALKGIFKAFGFMILCFAICSIISLGKSAKPAVWIAVSLILYFNLAAFSLWMQSADIACRFCLFYIILPVRNSYVRNTGILSQDKKIDPDLLRKMNSVLRHRRSG